MRLRTALLLATVAGLLAVPVALAAAVIVHPGNLQGWTANVDDCTPADGQPADGTQGFVAGPGDPLLGNGSYEFRIGSEGDTYRTLRHPAYNGVRLDDLTALAYTTYVQHFGSGGQAPYLVLVVDTSGEGVADDQLFFEPVYQNGSYATVAGVSVPNQGDLTTGTWQTWNALTGGWWALGAATFGPPLTTLAKYASEHPGAKIVNTLTGGLRIATGCGDGAWDDFVGNVDSLTIGVEGAASKTFNFEATAPGAKGHNKVTVCHHGKRTMQLPEPAARAHLRHGDVLGACATPSHEKERGHGKGKGKGKKKK